MHKEPTEAEQTSASSRITACADRFQESMRLSRFFAKLLTEALSLEATNINFEVTDSAIVVAIQRDKQELKSMRLKTSWHDPMLTWLSDRSWPGVNQSVDDLDGAGNKRLARESASVVRVGDQLLSVVVRRAGRSGSKSGFSLAQFSVLLVSQAHELLGLTPDTRPLFTAMTSAANGLLVVAATDDAQMARSRAALLSLTGFDAGGDFGQVQDRAQIIELASQYPVIATMRSDDVVDVLLKLKSAQFDVTRTNLMGIFLQGFARKVCPHCGREAVIDPKLLGTLPDCLRPTQLSAYRIGRGCDVCGHKGYAGYIGIQSILPFTDEIKGLYLGAADQAKLVAAAYSNGTRALLQDGVQKAMCGMMTFESLFEVVKTIPPAYVKLLRTSGDKTATVLVEGEEFYLKSPKDGQLKPLSGRAAYSGQSSGTHDSSPLFSVARSGQVRERPLLLVVEDDPDQQSILEMVLKSANYDIITAANGVEALDILAKQTPDLIMTDLMMPQMDGRALVSKLKSNRHFRDIPVLVLTVVSDAEKEYDLLDLGADDYCEKTIQRKILLKRIENMLKRSGAPARARGL